MCRSEPESADGDSGGLCERCLERSREPWWDWWDAWWDELSLGPWELLEQGYLTLGDVAHERMSGPLCREARRMLLTSDVLDPWRQHDSAPHSESRAGFPDLFEEMVEGARDFARGRLGPFRGLPEGDFEAAEDLLDQVSYALREADV